MPAGGLVGDASDGTRCWIAVTFAGALLAGLHALDRAAGLAPCPVAFGVVVVAGRRLAEWPVWVVDLELLAVVLDRAGGLPPGAPAPDRLRHRPERIGQVGGLLELGERGPLTRPQRQLSGDLQISAAGVAVAVHPGLVVLLLRRPSFDLGLSGPLGPQVPGGGGPHIQPAWGVDRQGLAAGAAQRGGELGVGVGRFPVGQVDLAGAGVGFGGDDGVQPGVLHGATAARTASWRPPGR
jgi:hypothetical protein